MANNHQHTTATSEQVYVNCEHCGYKQTLKASDLTDPLRLVCTGPDCSAQFSVKEGIKNAIVSDNDFMAWSFISDVIISGRETVFVGKSCDVRLKRPVSVIKKVFIAQSKTHGHAGDVHFEPKVILPNTLIIVSSGNEPMLGKPCEVDWVLYADTKSEHKEDWREYLQRAKESLVTHDFQSAIVEAEIAVEVTLASVLWELLTQRKGLGEDVVEWILGKSQAASERAKRVMELAVGQAVPDMDATVYRNWARLVADKRNRIVHQGEPATKEEAVDAIGAAFELIWLLLELVGKQPVEI